MVALFRLITFPFVWLFAMPPIEKRPMLKGKIRYLIYMDYDRKFDETYVYYKTFILNLWMNVFFMSAYLYSFLFQKYLDLGLFRINYRPEAAVDEMIFGYPLYVFPILVIVTVLHSIPLFLFKTDYLSRERIIHEHVPIANSKKDLYEVKPPALLLAIVFFVGMGFILWSIPSYFRGYQMYNYVHDFRSHNLTNFFLFGAAYFIACQTFFCQFFIAAPVNLIRSVLRHYIYKKDLIFEHKENQDANNE